MIADEMRRIGRPPAWEGPRTDSSRAILEILQKGDVVITIGAGDVTRTAYELKQELSAS